jgi:hypothetical protein
MQVEISPSDYFSCVHMLIWGMIITCWFIWLDYIFERNPANILNVCQVIRRPALSQVLMHLSSLLVMASSHQGQDTETAQKI